MPAGRSRSLGQDHAVVGFGRGSRYTAAANAAAANAKRVQMLHLMEGRSTRKQVQVLERHALLQRRRYSEQQQELREGLHRLRAYHRVCQRNLLAQARDYHAALNRRYSFGALKPQLADMLRRMDPSLIRQKRAQAEIERSRRDGEKVICRNLLTISTPRTRLREEDRHAQCNLAPTGDTGRSSDAKHTENNGGELGSKPEGQIGQHIYDDKVEMITSDEAPDKPPFSNVNVIIGKQISAKRNDRKGISANNEKKPGSSDKPPARKADDQQAKTQLPIISQKVRKRGKEATTVTYTTPRLPVIQELSQ